jgi:hypothetical protein
LQAAATDAAGYQHGEFREAPGALIAEAKNALSVAELAVRPATDQQRLAALFGLADVVGKPDVMRNGSPAAQTVFWRKYHELLGHIPPGALSRACDAYMRQPAKQGGKWFPDPGTLLNLARDDDEWRRAATLHKGLSRLAGAQPSRGDNFRAVDPSEAERKLETYLAGLRGRVQAERADKDLGANDYANPVRPWQRPGWKGASA